MTDSDMTMRERIARALVEAIEKQVAWSMRCDNTLDVDGHVDPLILADAALAEMAQPTKEMWYAGYALVPDDAMLDSAFSAMIRAAMEGK